MNMKNKKTIKSLFGKDLVISTLGAILFFFLGTGIARYLGNPIDGFVFFSGIGLVLFLLVSAFSLKEYFDLLDINLNKNQAYKNQQPDIEKNIHLLLGLAGLTAGCILSYVLFLSKAISIEGIPFWGILLVFVFLYAVPPIRLSARGYGEFLLCVIVANIIPAFAFLLQVDVLHKLVPLITFPLTGFYLAMLISTSLKKYFSDMLAGRQTMIIILDWKMSLDLHNWLIGGSFLLLATNSLLGLPWNLVWPMFLSVPIFGFTLFELHRIRNGSKPRWLLLDLLSYSGISIMCYMLLFTLWFR